MAGPLNTTAAAIAVGAPSVYNVPGPTGSVPTSSVNVSVSTTAVPTTLNVIYGGMPVVNQTTENPTSVGSLPAGGVVTGGINMDSQNIGCSSKLNVGGMMTTSTGDATGHNKDYNCMGAYVSPAPPCKWITGS